MSLEVMNVSTKVECGTWDMGTGKKPNGTLSIHGFHVCVQRPGCLSIRVVMRHYAPDRGKAAPKDIVTQFLEDKKFGKSVSYEREKYHTHNHHNQAVFPCAFAADPFGTAGYGDDGG